MAALPSSFSLKIGHTWLFPLFRWLDKLLAIVLQTLGTAWEPVRVMTAAALAANTWTLGTNTKVANANGKLTVNGVDLQIGDTFWDKDDAVGLRRGKFIVVDPGSASTPWIVKRSDDADASGEFTVGKKLIVSQGSNAGYYVFVTTPFTLNTTTPVVQTQSFVDLFSDQTITGAKSFAASALRVWNTGLTFATRFTSAATATRLVNFPDAAGDVLLDLATQTVGGAKKFATLMLQVWNAGATFVTKFQTNATAERTLTLPDASGIVLTSGNVIQLPFMGRNGAGVVAVVGARVGDVVYSLVEIAGGTPSDGRADFEAVITVNDQIQQTSVADLSAVPCIGYAARP